MNTLDTQACVIAAEMVQIWANWSDANEIESDLALRQCAKDARALDLRQVDGVLASPLNYYVRAELDDENPEDLTFCEMFESIEISLRIMRGEAV